MRGDVQSEHIVHFFDDDAARVSVVTAYIAEALAENHTALAVARARTWNGIAAGLRARGVEVSGHPRVLALDANQMLAEFMRRGRFDVDLFRRMFAPRIHAIAAASGGLTAYGEMVDVLASEGNFTAAQDLELAWNELASEVSLTLLCGYSSAHFASIQDRDAMTAICAAHSKVHTDSSDALGRWLVRETGLT